VSAKHHHRPPLIHAVTLDKRDNPKELTEGEMEKTHFAVGFNADQAFLLLEKKQGGVSAARIENYLNNHLRHLRGRGQRIECKLIVSGNFLAKLREMPKIMISEIFTSADLLTDTFLTDVPMATEVREEVELIFKAKKGRSIPKQLLSRLYRAFASDQANRKISRMRVLGKSEENDLLLLDTDSLTESEYIEVELDENGQVVTESISPKLRSMVRTMIRE